MANVFMNADRFVKITELMNIEKKLVRACQQIILLNDKVLSLTKRYQRAREEGHRCFRYNLRVRLAAVEGVRNMYYEYARARAEDIAELRKSLYNQTVEIITGSDNEDSDDEFSDDGMDTVEHLPTFNVNF